MKRSKLLLTLLSTLLLCSCYIEPPLHLAGQEIEVAVPIVETQMEIVWNTDVDLNTDWYYGWDQVDRQRWGELDYPTPTHFEVRRYFLNNERHAHHTNVDAFTVFGNSFRRSFSFGYYDMLIWSDIDSEDGTQVLVISEGADSTIATTSVTRGYQPRNTRAVVGLYNQPEIFYSAYPRDIYISDDFRDYDSYDSINHVFVKHLSATLLPRVYIYLVQVILHNNDGRVTGITGDAMISGLAASTSVNTGHTSNTPVNVYFDMRLKKNQDKKGENVDIIGGKLTTFGLCGMESYAETRAALYAGTRPLQENNLYVDISFNNGTDSTYIFPVKEQFQAQAHGGIITVDIDCNKLPIPQSEQPGRGSGFVPTVEDYEEVVYEFDM